MPRTIYQEKVPVLPAQASTVPAGWAYIGDYVCSNGTDITAPIVYNKVWVKNRVGNDWWILNADADLVVDYVYTDLHYNEVTVQITDTDFKTIVVKLYASNGTTLLKTVNLPDGTTWTTIGGLTQNTTYQTNVTGFSIEGNQASLNNWQTFKTPNDPTPRAPTSLRVTAASNSTINLAWDVPSGDSATKYRLYVLRSDGTQERTPILINAPTKTALVSALVADTKYQYRVAGINISGFEGPGSNTVRYATGHNEAVSAGRLAGAQLHPLECGSWRPDVGWRKATDAGGIYRIQQGYWQADPRTTGTTYNLARPWEEAGRYRGCITYDVARFHREYGHSQAMSLATERAELVRLYRYRWHGAHWPPEPQSANYMIWHLTNTNIFDSAAGPPIYSEHRNNRNDADAVASHDTLNSGSYHDWFRLPRSFGTAIAQGKMGGTPVNGLLLYRGDHQNSGSGAAGYGAWAGHGQKEYLSGWVHPERRSDLRLFVTGSYRFVSRSYLAPYAW